MNFFFLIFIKDVTETSGIVGRLSVSTGQILNDLFLMHHYLLTYSSKLVQASSEDDEDVTARFLNFLLTLSRVHYL